MNGEQTPTERLKEHLDRFAEIGAHAAFGLHNWGSNDPDDPTVKTYRLYIETAAERQSALQRELDGLA
jgi:hypothetical protein